ncbi:hypothetical protein HanHA300_Chr16g0613321 [Helianthus annuus]|nr:hypothetical protein HanHA300_Chr16g0613321 [Helianthus annuus]KAJ0460702.1 hypothetical protein HanHA89_Chr16g0663911 [Helianthus annuus]
MKLPITHQRFNIDVAISLLQDCEKLHVLPSLIGELQCSNIVKCQFSFSYVTQIFFFYRKHRLLQHREKLYVLPSLMGELHFRFVAYFY